MISVISSQVLWYSVVDKNRFELRNLTFFFGGGGVYKAVVLRVKEGRSGDGINQFYLRADVKTLRGGQVMEVASFRIESFGWPPLSLVMFLSLCALVAWMQHARVFEPLSTQIIWQSSKMRGFRNGILASVTECLSGALRLCRPLRKDRGSACAQGKKSKAHTSQTSIEKM